MPPSLPSNASQPALALSRKELEWILQALPRAMQEAQDTAQMAACLGLARFARRHGLACQTVHVTCSLRHPSVEFSFCHLRCAGAALDLGGTRGRRAVYHAAMAKGLQDSSAVASNLAQSQDLFTFESDTVPDDVAKWLDGSEPERVEILAAEALAAASTLHAARTAEHRLAASVRRTARPRPRA